MRLIGAAALAAALAATGLGLGGCGFEPLYASNSPVSPALSRVELIVPKGRAGFLLGRHLHEELASGHDAPRYRVLLTMRQTRFARGVRVNAVANRYELLLTIGYVLTEIETNKRLDSGTVVSDVSYDSADPPYAGVAAEQDAEDRGAGQGAVLLRLELSRYFAHLPGK